MYPNLKAGLVRRRMTIRDLSKLLGIPPQTLYTKTSGQTGFTLAEAVTIKKVLEVDMPLEDLFAQ